MPRPRNAENIGLPLRWRLIRGVFYYQVPPGHERYWQHKQTFRLGDTFEEALETFRAAGRAALDIDARQLTPIESLSAVRTPLVKQGVYFLFDQGEVVYVGRSDSIPTRLAQHVSIGAIEFDSWSCVPATGFEQERMEQLYIAVLTPKYNIKHVGKAA